MNDEQLYLDATNEVDGDNRNPALWAKVIALSEGDAEKAKYEYIKLRVKQLSQKAPKAQKTFTKKVVDDFKIKFLPVSELSKITNISEEKTIKMIKDGFYVGQIKDNVWYVSRDELDNKTDNSFVRASSKKSNNSKNEYIPVDEFSEFNGIDSEKIIEMIKDGFYQGQIIEDNWYVAYSEVEKTKEAETTTSGHFFDKLTSGSYGLAKTYWLFGFLGSWLFVIPIALAAAAESLGALIASVLASVVYTLIVAVGIWRASDKYQGPKVWAILAKIAVVIGIIRLLVSVFTLGSI